MKRIIYSNETKTIIETIENCEGTVTGTPFDIFEGTEEEVAQFILDKKLTQQVLPTE